MTLGGFSIDRLCYDTIRKILPNGVILELGSGFGTGELVKHYEVYSIEHDKQWIGKYGSNYIYAPIEDGWYDLSLAWWLPEKYDLILIDGPPSTIHPNIRLGFYVNIQLFNTDVPMIFDDVHRAAELSLAQNVALLVDRPMQVYGDKKKFAVV